MTILRSGSTEKYSNNWGSAFGKKKSTKAKPSAKKKSKPAKKKAAKKAKKK